MVEDDGLGIGGTVEVCVVSDDISYNFTFHTSNINATGEIHNYSKQATLYCS